MTNKEFRAVLNAAIPSGSPDNGRGQHGAFRPTKRPYGDYLWHQDRSQFEEEKARYEIGRHTLNH